MRSQGTWPIGRALVIIGTAVAVAFASAWVRWQVIGDTTPTPSTIELCYEESDAGLVAAEGPCAEDPRSVRTVPDDGGRTTPTRPPATRAPNS